MFTAQDKSTVGAPVTVNDAVQVDAVPGQVLVTVQVTVLLPPQALGAVPPLLLIDELQPPVNVALANQLEYAVFIAA